MYYSAPTNAAFKKLPAGAIDSLSDDELTNLLAYHVLVKEYVAPPGLLGSSIAVLKQGNFKYATARTNEDPNEIKVNVDGDNVFVKDYAQVIKKNIIGSNGIIHVLDEVIANKSLREAAPTTKSPTGRPTRRPSRRPTRRPTRRPRN